MAARFIILIALVFCVSSRAETIISQSRQFIVHSSDAPAPLEKVPANSVQVEPQLLAVTAERVKKALVAEIPALAVGRHQIHLGILDRAPADSQIGIASSRYADAWRYEVAVPRVVEQARLVKGLIDVVLLEYANRSAERSAELPSWLTEGLAQQLLYSVGPKLVVDRVPDAWEAAARDLQYLSRETLRTNTTPTFQEVTTALPPAHNSPGEALYLGATHLLVQSLLTLPNGRQRFANFLQTLPQTWNWQTAFQQAFGFERMLDVEKWWALATIEFTTRDQRQAWSTEASLRKLDELLLTRVQYHSASNALPVTRQVDLKTILEETDLTLQQQALDEKIAQLGYTAPHMAPQVSALALDYKKILELYLQRRSGINVQPSLRTTPHAQNQALVTDTLRRLAALDAKARTLAEPTISSTR